MGLNIPDDILEYIHKGNVSGSKNHDEYDLSAALGFTAIFVDICSKYLDIPLRYPIKIKGSQTFIFNFSPHEELKTSHGIMFI